MEDIIINVGKNIKEVRQEKNMSQEKLGRACNIANTTISAYENGRKNANLYSLAAIAKALDTTIDRLVYGDENSAFIDVEVDEGKKIVKSVYYLWQTGCISYYENFNSNSSSITIPNSKNNQEPNGIYLYISKHPSPLKRLLQSLDEYMKQKDTYPEPEQYLNMLFASVAKEINNEIEEENQRKKAIEEIRKTPRPR